MQTPFERVDAALSALKQGKMIILTDSPDRENEGDLICPAETITPEMMNFMIRNGSGIVCLSMTAEHLARINLPLMVAHSSNGSTRGTPFTVSIDAKDGITTGVSATDRVKTIQAAINDNFNPDAIVKPGHIFPLQARNNGVLERQGHTEGTVDLARLAGFKPAGVLCEIMNPDGSMTHGDELSIFAEKHQLVLLSIDDIIAYRLRHENMIGEEAKATLPIDQYGTFDINIINDKLNNGSHIILKKPVVDSNKPMLVRIHSACITGDLFSSLRCDCHAQLHYSLERISEEGGMLIYLDQEGRGIGLLNKIKAYALQENGRDTVQANVELGLPVDARQYYLAAHILHQQNIQHIRLLTNNLQKIFELKQLGITYVDREAIPAFPNAHNQQYLKTKVEKLNHQMQIEGDNHANQLCDHC